MFTKIAEDCVFAQVIDQVFLWSLFPRFLTSWRLNNGWVKLGGSIAPGLWRNIGVVVPSLVLLRIWHSAVMFLIAQALGWWLSG